MGSLGEIPSVGYNPLRTAIDPNDPDYLKKISRAGIMEGLHEMSLPKDQPPLQSAENSSEQPTKKTSEIPGSDKGPVMPAPKMASVGEPPQETSGPPSGLSVLPIGSEPPVGSPQKPQRSLLGKIGHGLAEAGNIAGDIFVPSTMMLIPGTQLHGEMERGKQLREQNIEKQQQIEQQRLEEDTAYRTMVGQAALERGAAATTTAGANVEKAEAATSRAATEDFKAKHPNAKPEFFVDADGKVVQGYAEGKNFFLASGDPLPANYVPYKSPSTAMQKPVQGSVNNQPQWGIYDPKQGWIDPETKQPIANFAPPPSWAEVMPSTHTVNMLNPEGIPTTYQYNSQTKGFDIVAGQAAGGAYAHAEAQAGAVTRAGNALISDIQANEKAIDQSKLGSWLTWVKKYGLNTPFADPVLGRLQAEYMSWAALNPAMHGYRSVQAMKAFEDLVGGLQKNPEAAIASLRGTLQTASAVNPALKGGGEGTKEIPAGAIMGTLKGKKGYVLNGKFTATE
jgi:hypothetical protein